METERSLKVVVRRGDSLPFGRLFLPFGSPSVRLCVLCGKKSSPGFDLPEWLWYLPGLKNPVPPPVGRWGPW